MPEISVSIVRTWLPSIYQDELVPPMTAAPSDWLVKLPDGRWAMPPDLVDGELPKTGHGAVLNDGDVVKFDWTERHGFAELTIESADKWTCTREMPSVAGGWALVCEAGDWESSASDIDEFVANWCDMASKAHFPAEITVEFYVWSNGEVLFEFRAGKLHERGVAN